MCRCRLILGKKKCTTLVSNVDNGGGSAHVGAGVNGKSVPSSQFYYKSKSALKNQSFQKINNVK